MFFFKNNPKNKVYDDKGIDVARYDTLNDNVLSSFKDEFTGVEQIKIEKIAGQRTSGVSIYLNKTNSSPAGMILSFYYINKTVHLQITTTTPYISIGSIVYFKFDDGRVFNLTTYTNPGVYNIRGIDTYSYLAALPEEYFSWFYLKRLDKIKVASGVNYWISDLTDIDDMFESKQELQYSLSEITLRFYSAFAEMQANK